MSCYLHPTSATISFQLSFYYIFEVGKFWILSLLPQFLIIKWIWEFSKATMNYIIYTRDSRASSSKWKDRRFFSRQLNNLGLLEIKPPPIIFNQTMNLKFLSKKKLIEISKFVILELHLQIAKADVSSLWSWRGLACSKSRHLQIPLNFWWLELGA